MRQYGLVFNEIINNDYVRHKETLCFSAVSSYNKVKVEEIVFDIML